MQALLRDAHRRRLVSVRVLLLLALGYERKIAELEQQHPKSKAAPEKAAPEKAAPEKPMRRPSEKRQRDDATAGQFADGVDAAERGEASQEKAHKTEAAEAKARQRLHKRLYGHVEAMLSDLGGSKERLTSFFVLMISAAAAKTGLARVRHLSQDVVMRLLDNAALAKRIMKDVDARRRPEAVRFVLANLRGCSTTAMDALRFATTWTPGHSTFSKLKKELEERVLNIWCPCGFDAGEGTTLDEEAQRAQVEVEEEQPEERAEELERELDEVMRGAATAEPTHEDLREASAESFTSQGLELLRTTYPGRPEKKYLDQWTGGVNAPPDSIFHGANSIHIIMHEKGTLMGFIKVLRSNSELFVDELLVAERGRRKGLASHLMLRALSYSPRAQLVRLQVDAANRDGISTYKAWTMHDWQDRDCRNNKYYGAQEWNDEGCIFMEGKRSTMAAHLTEFLVMKQLSSDIEVFTMAALPMGKHAFDFVGIPEEPEEPAAPQAAPAAAGGDGEQQNDDDELPAPEAPSQIPAADAAPGGVDVDGDDTMPPEAETKEVQRAYGLRAISNAVIMLLISTRKRPAQLGRPGTRLHVRCSHRSPCSLRHGRPLQQGSVSAG